MRERAGEEEFPGASQSAGERGNGFRENNSIFIQQQCNVKGERAPLDSQAANYGVFGNVLVIGGFAAFAFVVRYVLQSMANIE